MHVHLDEILELSDVPGSEDIEDVKPFIINDTPTVEYVVNLLKCDGIVPNEETIAAAVNVEVVKAPNDRELIAELIPARDAAGNVVRSFGTGAIRNDATGKPRMSLLPHDEILRVLERYREGAASKGEDNWKLGMPVREMYDSAQRHLMAWWMGDKSEDHAAAAVWNILGAMWMEKNKPEMDSRTK